MNAVRTIIQQATPIRQTIANLKDIEASITYNTASLQDLRIGRIAHVLNKVLDDLEARITALEARHE